MLKNYRGFTLIELLIVFAVLAIISTVSAVSFISYSKVQTLSNTAKDIEQMLTIAKSRSQSQVKPKPPACEDQSLIGYEFRFCGDEACRAATTVCRNICSDDYNACTDECQGSNVESCVSACRVGRSACVTDCNSDSACAGQQVCESSGDYEVVAMCTDEGGGEQAILTVPAEGSPPKILPSGIIVVDNQDSLFKTRFKVLTGGVTGPGKITIQEAANPDAERTITVDAAGTIRENL